MNLFVQMNNCREAFGQWGEQGRGEQIDVKEWEYFISLV